MKRGYVQDLLRFLSDPNHPPLRVFKGRRRSEMPVLTREDLRELIEELKSDNKEKTNE